LKPNFEKNSNMAIPAKANQGGNAVLTKNEIAEVEKRHKAFQAKPSEFITIEALNEKLKNLGQFLPTANSLQQPPAGAPTFP
jgi:Ca2+-binding EF-hand superfamily protein